MSVVIFAAALIMLRGWHPSWRDTIALRLGTGLGSGFLSGLSSIGGMFAATMLFTTSLPAARFRATLITLFFVSAWYGLAWAGQQGLATGATTLWAAWLIVPMLVGIAIGRHVFCALCRSAVPARGAAVLAAVAGARLRACDVVAFF